MRIKTDDTVEVISGNDRGKQGRVLSVDRKNGKVLVEGCNRVYKHVRRSQKNPQGGRLSKEMPLQISNLALVCSHCAKGVRLGSRIADDGSKERFCRKCGAGLGQIAPAKEQQTSS